MPTSAPQPKLPFKISVLVFVRDTIGRHLLIERLREPNKNLFSPIGGKLEMALGESPFECAVRETREEIGLSLRESDLHLFAMISEKSYEGGTHWLMFLFDCRPRLDALPPDISEGVFHFVSADEILSGKIPVPETDKVFIWDVWRRFHSSGFAALRADCSNGVRAVLEESISAPSQSPDSSDNPDTPASSNPLDSSSSEFPAPDVSQSPAPRV